MGSVVKQRLGIDDIWSALLATVLVCGVFFN